MFNKGELIGSISVAYNDNGEFVVLNTFNDFQLKALSFLFIVDKVLADFTGESKKKNILANILGLILGNQRIEGEEIDSFGHYNKVDYLNYEKHFEANFEFRNKFVENGQHYYIWSKYSPMFATNIEGKLGTATMLYTIDVLQRITEKQREFLTNVFSALFSEYQIVGLPDTSNITVAPTNVFNIVSNM